MTGRRWRIEDFQANAEEVAARLLGSRLVCTTRSGTRVSGTIVETEAYLGAPDLASHAVGGRRTARNEVMYAGPGRAYVYFIYGMHYCFNVVCGEPGQAHAILVRALRPDEGVDLMRRRRAIPGGRPMRDRDLCAGPARLCRALGIDRTLNGADLLSAGRVFIEHGERVGLPGTVERTARIGVEYAGEWAEAPLRWVVGGCEFASRGAGRAGVKVVTSGGRGR